VKTAIRTYQDLIVWQKSMALAVLIYEVTRDFPKEEIYGLTVQIRRSAVSVPSNIGEGYGRNSTGDYRRFLQVAMGSVCELETQLILTSRLGFLSKSQYDRLASDLDEVERMLSALIRKVH
jgi:four helix bundle protein